MNKHTQQHKTDVVFSLLIFVTFAISVLITLMLGASFYQRMTGMSKDGYDERTSLSYVWTKIKNNDNIDMISVDDFNGIPSLVLYQYYGDTKYVTRIYTYDGWIYELFSDADLEMLPENGTPIIKTDSLIFEKQEEGLIKVSSGSGNVLIQPRGREGLKRGAFD
jgi:hypothetical protein